MKRVLTAVAALCSILAMNTAAAQDGSEPPSFSPLELFVCNYRDGQDQGDFDKAVEELQDWQNANGDPYSAWRLFPYYTGPNLNPDFVYIGSWPSGSAMGTDMQKFMASGADANETWNEAVECNVSGMFASHNVKAPPENVDAGNFTLTVADCKVAHHRSTGDAIAAMRRWGSFRADNDSPGGMWLWIPVYGGNGGGDGEDLAFKVVHGFSGFESLGNYWSWYVDNMAYEKWGDLTDGLLSCDTARLYTGETLINGLSAGNE